MGKNRRVFLITLFVVVPCIVFAISIQITFQEILRRNRYGPGELLANVAVPTPAPLNAKLNNDLAKMVSRYQASLISSMDLSTVTPFAWDRVHIFAKFAEFMDYEDIDRILGRSWSNIDSCDYAAIVTIAHGDSGSVHGRGYSLFIFTYESTVVYCLFYKDTPQAHLYVNSTDIKSGIPREDALFIIDKEGIIRPIEK